MLWPFLLIRKFVSVAVRMATLPFGICTTRHWCDSSKATLMVPHALTLAMMAWNCGPVAWTTPSVRGTCAKAVNCTSTTLPRKSFRSATVQPVNGWQLGMSISVPFLFGSSNLSICPFQHGKFKRGSVAREQTRQVPTAFARELRPFAEVRQLRQMVRLDGQGQPPQCLAYTVWRLHFPGECYIKVLHII